MQLVREFLSDSDDEYVQCRVACRIEDEDPYEWPFCPGTSESFWFKDDKDKFQLSKAAADLYGVKELRFADLQFTLRFPLTEWDDQDWGYWPVLGCLWCISRRQLLQRFDSRSPDGFQEDLWGNQGNFNIYWYKTAALIVRVREEDSPHFDNDITLYDGDGWSSWHNSEYRAHD